jgi:hypothetical protein
MRQLVVLVLVVGLSSSRAHADGNREMWQAAFAGSVTLTLGGVMFYWHGANKVSEAEDELCARGAYPFDPGCPTTGNPPITQDELDRINAKGDRGSTIAKLGFGMTMTGAVLTGITLYKGFLAKPKKESSVVVVPTASKDGAGAALTLRW